MDSSRSEALLRDRWLFKWRSVVGGYLCSQLTIGSSWMQVLNSFDKFRKNKHQQQWLLKKKTNVFHTTNIDSSCCDGFTQRTWPSLDARRIDWKAGIGLQRASSQLGLVTQRCFQRNRPTLQEMMNHDMSHHHVVHIWSYLYDVSWRSFAGFQNKV